MLQHRQQPQHQQRRPSFPKTHHSHNSRRAKQKSSSSSSSSLRAILSPTGVIVLFVSLLLAIQLYMLWYHHRIQENDRNRRSSNNHNNTSSIIYPPWDLTAESETQQAALLQSLPMWIQNYIAWHAKMRRQFPGKALFEHPDAPPVLIRTCLGLCGGLNDRLGQLPWDLYLANQTGRVLLIHWHRPVPLEEFFQPQPKRSTAAQQQHTNNNDKKQQQEFILDWRVPPDIPGFFPAKGEARVSREAMREPRAAYPDMFEGYASDRPEPDFWNEHLDIALERARTIGVGGGETFSKHHHVLRHRILGHLDEQVLEKRLAALGETDLLHSTPSFGRIFHLFFRPAQAVEKEITTVLNDLQQASSSPSSNSFSAVHCRVRHPKATTGVVKGRNENYPADKSGLPWFGETRAYAIATAVHALRCARSLHPGHEREAVDSRSSSSDPIYFFSDSNDLVRFMTRELKNSTYLAANPFNESTAIDKEAFEVVKSIPGLIARDPETENAHIDKQKGRDAPAYFGTIVDFYVATAARCVTYGIGYYAVFATKVSGTDCTMLYQEEAWGGTDAKQLHSTSQCTLPAPALLQNAPKAASD